MFGTWVNFFAILIGSLIGLFLHRGISTKITSTLMKGLGLVIVLLGIEGSIQVTNWTMLIVCIAVGSFLGEWIDIEARLEKFGLFVESRVAKNAKGTFATGFVTASLLFGVGAMAIQGALNDGLFHDSTTLITKSLLDFIGSIVFASTMGIGVMFSAFVILIYQGSITLLSSFARPLLSDLVIFDMGIVGSVIIIGLGLKMMKISDIKVANLIPAMFLPIVFHPLFDFIATLWSRI